MCRAPLVSLNEATLSHSGGVIFSKLSLNIHEGQRIALVGKNGAGKTSLLSLLAGRSEISGGTFAKRRNLRVGYVSQFLTEVQMNNSVRREVEKSLTGQTLVTPMIHWIECIAAQFEFPIDMLDMPFLHLSGGWVNRAVLLCEMAKDPDILLLDEPTNHMDIEGIKKFEDLLSERVGCAIFMVCHDVDVLDRVCNSTWFLRDGIMECFDLSYSLAVDELRVKDEAREERRRAQLKEIGRVKESAKTLATWGQVYHNEKFSRRARSMQKRMERMEESLQTVVRERHGNVTITRRAFDADWLIHVPEQVFSTPNGRHLFKNRDLFFGPGERVILLGENGTGKSTFVRALMQSFRMGSDDFRFNPRISLGYYDQDLSNVEGVISIFRFVRDNVSGIDDPALRKLLVDAGFPFEEQQKPVSVCSGGEKARLHLLRLRLAAPNFLVLDEPTNHLDLYGISALSAQLVEKEIPAIVVTHNRAFAREVGTRFFRISQGRLEELLDGSFIH
jgi:ATP-binding cassette subfamily F protein 3